MGYPVGEMMTVVLFTGPRSVIYMHLMVSITILHQLRG